MSRHRRIAAQQDRATSAKPAPPNSDRQTAKIASFRSSLSPIGRDDATEGLVQRRNRIILVPIRLRAVWLRALFQKPLTRVRGLRGGRRGGWVLETQSQLGITTITDDERIVLLGAACLLGVGSCLHLLRSGHAATGQLPRQVSGRFVGYAAPDRTGRLPPIRRD